MKTILITDDSFIMRNWLMKLLKKDDVKFYEASNGKMALETIEKENIDLVILDLLMPEYDGFYFLDSIKGKNIYKNVIVLSADIQDTTKEKVFKYNVKAFLNKPPKEEELNKIIKEVFQ